MTYLAAALLACALKQAVSQTLSIEGQASGWLASSPEHSVLSQAGLRYIPLFRLELGLVDDLQFDAELALNAIAHAEFPSDRSAEYSARMKLYRGTLRISSSRFEARIGLQKLSFGSAMMLRPLMWFDSIDPRDPLQLTDGVYGALLRYYFLNNANVWIWALHANDERKGWELSPTKDRSTEYGARVQTPLGSGELALTYNHRKADLSDLVPASASARDCTAPEDRFGLDGKWDVGPGVWFEAVMTRQAATIPLPEYQRQWTLGADYVIRVGNGLTAAFEYLRIESAGRLFGDGSRAGFSALSLSYPAGLLDRLSGILYYDWKNEQWYRILSWQRTYDDWTAVLQGFWNPEVVRLYRTESTENPFAGIGIRMLIVFNH